VAEGEKLTNAKPIPGILPLAGDPNGELSYDIITQIDPSARKQTLLVLINGFQRNKLDFRALRKRLHDACPGLITAALDNRGVGETRTNASFTLADMAGDVCSLVNTIHARFGQMDCILLGISMGGMIAQLAAAQLLASSNSSLKGLILASTTGGGTLRVRSELPLYAPGTRDTSGWAEDYDSHKQRMLRYFGSRFRKSSPLLIDAMAKNVFKTASQENEQSRAAAQFQATRHFDAAEALEHIKGSKLPTLVVCGEEDEIMPLQNSVNLHALLSGQSTLVTYPETGHLLLIEEPENFASAIASFVSQF
jgi:pimeloyl-ACP methyl ester carboxylesterase